MLLENNLGQKVDLYSLPLATALDYLAVKDMELDSMTLELEQRAKDMGIQLPKDTKGGAPDPVNSPHVGGA